MLFVLSFHLFLVVSIINLIRSPTIITKGKIQISQGDLKCIRESNFQPNASENAINIKNCDAIPINCCPENLLLISLHVIHNLSDNQEINPQFVPYQVLK